MHDPTYDTEFPKLSDDIIYVVSQLRRMSSKGPLVLDEASVAALLFDLENSFRRSLEMEKHFYVLRRSHARIARISGIYDVPNLPEKRRAAFAVVGGTEARTKDEGASGDR